MFNKIDTEQIDKIMGLIDTVLAAQNGPQLPQGIFHMLLRKAASYVDLDVDQVDEILESEPDIPTAPEGQPGLVGPDGQPLDPAQAGTAQPSDVAAGPSAAGAGGPGPVDSGQAEDGSPEALTAKLEAAGVKV